MLYRRTICYIVSLCLLLPSVASAQVEEVETIRIISVDDSQFPEMSVRFTATNSNNANIFELTSDDFMVFENDQPVDSVSLTDGNPINDYTAVVLDLGEYSNLHEFDQNSLKQALNAFVDSSRFQNGKDSIALFATFGSTKEAQTLVSFTSSTAIYQNTVSKLTFTQTGVSHSLATVEYAYEALLNAAAPNLTNLSVIYIGPLFDDGQDHIDDIQREVQRLSTRFKDSATLFYALETADYDDYWTEPTKRLTENTGGIILRAMPDDENYFTAFHDIAKDIEYQNETYQLNYRSKSATNSIRNIRIATSENRLGIVGADAVVTTGGSTSNAVVESASPTWLLYTAIGVLPLLLVGGFFYYRRTTQESKRPISPPPARTRETMMVGSISQTRKTMMEDDIGRTPLATLVILTAKADRVHQTYSIFNDLTVLGRDPHYTDLQLYDADDKSTVSGRHCTIQYQTSSRKFTINDHSTSGTQVNNQRLERDRPIELADGAEITLGLIAQKGAKVRFELPTQNAVSSETMLDFDLQGQEASATVFDDFGTVTQLGSDEFDDVFESSSPSDEQTTNKDWMQDLE